MADVGTGVTILFATSAYAGVVLGISAGDAERPVIDTTHAGTTVSRTKMPGDLLDEGEITVDIEFDPDTPPPMTSAAETVTITFPVPAGLTNGATAVGSGFISKKNWEVPVEEKMVGSYVLTWAGTVAWTDAS